MQGEVFGYFVLVEVCEDGGVEDLNYVYPAHDDEQEVSISFEVVLVCLMDFLETLRVDVFCRSSRFEEFVPTVYLGVWEFGVFCFGVEVLGELDECVPVECVLSVVPTESVDGSAGATV